jgi:hypothetical protein
MFCTLQFYLKVKHAELTHSAGKQTQFLVHSVCSFDTRSPFINHPAYLHHLDSQIIKHTTPCRQLNYCRNITATMNILDFFFYLALIFTIYVLGIFYLCFNFVPPQGTIMLRYTSFLALYTFICLISLCATYSLSGPIDSPYTKYACSLVGSFLILWDTFLVYSAFRLGLYAQVPANLPRPITRQQQLNLLLQQRHKMELCAQEEHQIAMEKSIRAEAEYCRWFPEQIKKNPENKQALIDQYWREPEAR